MTCPVGLLRGSAIPETGLLPCAGDQGHPDAPSESMRGFADSSTDLSALGCASAGSLTGASNNHNDSFPLVLSFSSFCALHRFR